MSARSTARTFAKTPPSTVTQATVHGTPSAWWQSPQAQTLWRLGLTGALLYVVFRQVDVVQMWQRMQQLHPGVLLGFLGLEVVIAALAGWRWAVLTLPNPSWSQIQDFFKATMVGLFYNLFMPTSMGGDLVKWTALAHLQIPKTKLVFTMLLDRVMGMMGLIVCGFFGVILVKAWGLAQLPAAVIWLFSGLFAGVVGFLGFIYSPLELAAIPLVRRVRVLLQAEAYFAAHKRAFLQAFGLGLVVQVAWIVMVYWLAKELGFTTGFWQFVAIQPVVSAVTTLPISFAGFGATEVGFVYFYQQLGESSSVILALTSLLGVLRILVGGLGWLVGMGGRKKR